MSYDDNNARFIKYKPLNQEYKSKKIKVIDKELKDSSNQCDKYMNKMLADIRKSEKEAKKSLVRYNFLKS